MSEYATYDSYERLIGQFEKPGLLTGPIKNRPFTLVLLDEIEKAHYNVFDLCLQIFDAGRLTDAQGAVANFRHTMFVMTSNVGAARLAESPMGFGPEQVVALQGRALDKELRRHFRPEFLNRLDRIVPFRALSEASVREIARRELDKALLRSGLKRRRMQVEVSAEVEKLLFAEGYSPLYGAREMKRTIEKRALQPLAKALAEGTYPAGASLKLVLDKNDVVVRQVEPAAPAGKFVVPEKTPAPKPAAEKPAREKSSPRKSVASAKKKAKGQTT
jgi:ATP-dependent Clp protease ATP-binding subunit ClpA